MGIRNTIAKWLLRNATDITTGMSAEQLLREMLVGQQSDAGIDVSPDSAIRCADVYACVRVLAESKAQLPCPIYKRRADGGRERDTSHPLYRVLNVQPNAWQTAFEFHEMQMGHLALRGNAYAFIGRDLLTKQVRSLLPLHPARVTVKQRDDTTLEYVVTLKDGSPKTYPQSDILHLRGLSFDGITGVTPITAYRNAVGLSLAAERHQSKAFANGVKFPGVLKHPESLSEDAAKQLKADFVEMHSGGNAHIPPVLTEGLEWQTVGMTDTDAQTIETRKMQRSEICGIFRVPPHMIGDLDRATFSNIEHQSLEFVMHSLMPWLRRSEQSYQRSLFTERDQETYYAEHLVDHFLRGDLKSRYEAHARAVLTGWKSRNEVRITENLNPADGLDEFLQPSNMLPAGEEQTNDQTPPTQQPRR